jgi:hypothetical protein
MHDFTKRSASAAAHESGHALLGWICGHPVAEIRVFTPSEALHKHACYGDDFTPVAEGETEFVAPQRICPGPWVNEEIPGPRPLSARRVDLECFTMINMAGAIAEAAHLRCDIAKVLPTAAGDLQAMEVRLDAFFTPGPEVSAFTKLQSDRVRAVLASPQGDHIMKHLCSWLTDRGCVTGEMLDDICTATYFGDMPSTDLWRSRGLPSVKMLREGNLFGKADYIKPPVLPSPLNSTIWLNETFWGDRYDLIKNGKRLQSEATRLEQENADLRKALLEVTPDEGAMQ